MLRLLTICDFNISFGPDILTSLQIKGQVLHRAYACLKLQYQVD